MTNETRDRDVAPFDARALGYEAGRRGRMHREIADRSAALAVACAPAAKRLLDVGCGTGYQLRTLAVLLPDAQRLTGIDPAPRMVEVASSRAEDSRLSFSVAAAEELPFDDDSFDLVVSTTSFDHWRDQRAGLSECARVLAGGGELVLTDLFSAWLLATLVGERREKARTKRRAGALLRGAGFSSLQWHDLYAVIIRAVTATRPQSEPAA